MTTKTSLFCAETGCLKAFNKCYNGLSVIFLKMFIPSLARKSLRLLVFSFALSASSAFAQQLRCSWTPEVKAKVIADANTEKRANDLCNIAYIYALSGSKWDDMMRSQIPSLNMTTMGCGWETSNIWKAVAKKKCPQYW